MLWCLGSLRETSRGSTFIHKHHLRSHYLAKMTEVEPVLDFASSGRSGRRNALPDILGSPVGVPPDLPLKLAELSLTDGPGDAQSPSTEEPPTPTESPEAKEGS
ncbi:cAMP-dependent protein kinase inhibitor alpha-like [Onychostoma macrolepis]|uniref:cAMP-dependent protein kinase inhibitor alpha-like n=1 Tax=Onychostoma macrolepis TaxID=369639 RepID=UPI0027298E6B|nr:cAMP-dependent protein kinase inhibitor alpha-like [Onychostoma macrolepis]XP_058602963.1 cAMP-dependent protein kinase inhibitor alpha-like [Onychostoma macrolepis]